MTLSVNATDPLRPDGTSSGVASAILYVDGVQAGSPGDRDIHAHLPLDTTNLSPGVHVLTAKATDAAGNYGRHRRQQQRDCEQHRPHAL